MLPDIRPHFSELMKKVNSFDSRLSYHPAKIALFAGAIGVSLFALVALNDPSLTEADVAAICATFTDPKPYYERYQDITIFSKDMGTNDDPDPRRITIGNTDILAYQDGKTSYRNITNSPDENEEYPSVSSRGEVAYVRRGPRQKLEVNTPSYYHINYGSTPRAGVYINQIDGSAEQLITKITDNETRVFNTVWSPDGSKLAFAEYKVYAEKASHLKIYNRDRNLLTDASIEDTESDTYIGSITFSPNGKTISYVNATGARLIDSDGRNDRPLTKAEGIDHQTGADQAVFWITDKLLLVHNTRRLHQGVIQPGMRSLDELFVKNMHLYRPNGTQIATLKDTLSCNQK